MKEYLVLSGFTGRLEDYATKSKATFRNSGLYYNMADHFYRKKNDRFLIKLVALLKRPVKLLVCLYDIIKIFDL